MTNDRLPDFLITSDLHLRLDTPECRLDNYFEAQSDKLKFLKDLQEEYKCPIIDAGDVFNSWKVPPELEAWAIRNMPKSFYTIPGNHDLKNKNIDFFDKSSLNVLYQAGSIKLLNLKQPDILIDKKFKIIGFPWGFNYTDYSDLSKENINVMIIHDMIYHNKFIYDKNGAIIGNSIKSIFKKMPGFKIIISGHNHQSFAIQNSDGRWLINPGSMMRMRSDQMDHAPTIYAYNGKCNEMWIIYYPFKDAKSIMTRKHLEIQEKKEEKYNAFVERLDGTYEIGLSFKDNILCHFETNREDDAVRDMVMECIE